MLLWIQFSTSRVVIPVCLCCCLSRRPKTKQSLITHGTWLSIDQSFWLGTCQNSSNHEGLHVSSIERLMLLSFQIIRYKFWYVHKHSVCLHIYQNLYTKKVKIFYNLEWRVPLKKWFLDTTFLIYKDRLKGSLSRKNLEIIKKNM